MSFVVTDVEKSLLRFLLKKLREEHVSNPNERLIQSYSRAWLDSKDFALPQKIQEDIVQKTVDGIIGLGPLEELLRDHTVSEIMVNGGDHIFIEKNGQIQKTSLVFQDEEHVIRVINRIVGQIGRRIDQKNPLVDARLMDGSRVNAVIKPLSLSGALLTIRKFPTKAFVFKDLLEHQSASEEMISFLEKAIVEKQNILISGGTGAGKTSTLNACATFIPENERIITIEDVAEIQMSHPHHISLESRAANIEGEGAIPIRALVKNALRMRPDRILVGEIRGEEVIDMLQAMNTGHKGSLTTVHANTPLESLHRIETMVLMGGDMPLQAIRPQIVRALDLVVQQQRLPNGSRKITRIARVDKSDPNQFQVQDIFAYDDESGSFKRFDV